MKQNCGVMRAGVVLAGTLMIASCGATIKKLSGEAHPSEIRAATLPITVGIEMFRDSRGEQSAANSEHWGEGLASVLADQQVFKRIVYPYQGEPVDLILKASVDSKWSGGGANFATYFPGGLVFAPSWRGTQFRYNVDATVDVFAPDQSKLIGQFNASNSYKITHKSANPMHFLGAALVFPAVLTGSLRTWPRSRYRKMVYEQSYQDLWRGMAETMLRDPTIFEVRQKPGAGSSGS